MMHLKTWHKKTCETFKLRLHLRMVPSFATAHMFCTSRDDPRGSDLLRMVPTNSKVFSVQFIKMREKKILASVIEIGKEI